MRQRLAALLAVVLGLAVASAAGAQSSGVSIEVPVNEENYPRVAVKVTAPAELAGARLPEDAFRITENGEQRELSFGNSPENTVPSVVLVIDVSGSMVNAIEQAKRAATTLATSLPPSSEIALATFGENADVVLPFTTDIGVVQQAIEAVEVADPQAETALYDGVIAAADVFDTAKNELASIVLLSDGKDTSSRASEDDAIGRLNESTATLYGVGLQTYEDDFSILQRLARGRGEVAEAANSDALQAIYGTLAIDLSRQYILKYESRATGEIELGVAVDWNGVRSGVAEDIELTGTPRTQPAAPVIAAPDPFTVRPTLLSSRPALITGTAALALGGFVLLSILLSPRRTTTRERLRLLPEQGTGGNRRRLTGIVEWTTSLADRAVRRADVGKRLDHSLEEAGLELRPGELVVIGLSAMIVASTVGVLAGTPMFGLLLAAIVPLIMRLALVIRRDRRQAAFSEQLTDLLQLLSGSLRAGYGLLQGIDAVARDADEPASSEFRRILIEHRLGRDLNEAMANCAERMKNDDFAWVVQAIAIHRDVGGDLARVLDNIIATVRARGEVHRQVRALSAEGRMSATVLTALPLLVLVALQFMSPDYLGELYTNPIGLVLLGLSGVLMLVGILWIRRLVRIRY